MLMTCECDFKCPKFRNYSFFLLFEFFLCFICFQLNFISKDGIFILISSGEGEKKREEIVFLFNIMNGYQNLMGIENRKNRRDKKKLCDLPSKTFL